METFIHDVTISDITIEDSSTAEYKGASLEFTRSGGYPS